MNQNSLLSLYNSLAALSTPVTRLVEGKPVTAPLQFTGGTRLKIARAMAAVRPLVESLQVAQSEIVKQHGGPWPNADDMPPERQAAVAEIDNLLRSEVSDVPSFTLPLAEFVKDDNPVPPAILSDLVPFLKE